MCGIAGILNVSSNANVDRSQIERMIATLLHRGPDAWGTWISPQMKLGHVRLSILDLEGGHQPMTADPYVISFNGEIYNHVELRDELSALGVAFQTRSDTEVALKAYAMWGADCIAKFNGQFALLIWNNVENTLVAARDRYGIRPLYVMEWEDSTYFASEIKAFDTLSGFSRQFNPQRLFEHGLLWNTLDDETVYDGVRTLAPGTYEIFKTGQTVKRHSYYTLGETLERTPQRTWNESLDEFRELLSDSVKLRLRSDVPVGCYLSGGIDSSVTSYLASAINEERLKTFSVAFEDKQYDESTFQSQMVNKLGSEHLELSIDYDKVADHFADAVYHFERPVFRTAPVPLYLLSKQVRDSDIKVVLTGEAADEILFGYDSFKEVKLLQFWSRQPKSKFRPLLIKRLYPHLQHYTDPKQFGLMRMFYEEFLGEFDNDLVGLNIRTSNNAICANYLNKDFGISYSKEALLERIKTILPQNYSRFSLLQKNQFMEMKSILSGCLLSAQGDRMSMAHSVEGRYPFLDHRLVEMCIACPDVFKLNVFSQKHLLREAYRGQIPDTIVDRPKLPYQAPDLKAFLTEDGKLRGSAFAFLSESAIGDYGVFDPKMVNRFLRKFERRVPEKIGYRDNMMIAFMLSAQMALYWSKNPKISRLDESLKRVDVIAQQEK